MENLTQIVIEQALLWAPKAAIALVVLLVFWLVANFAHRSISAIGERTRLNKHVASLLARTARVALIIVGVITALGTAGMDVTALVVGLGLTGFALGFALKDTISNLLAGVLILVYRPFEVNDRIKIGGYEGTVVSSISATPSSREKDRRS